MSNDTQGSGVPLGVYQVFTWPTPDLRDFIFFVVKDGDLPANRGDEPSKRQWNYGDPFPDKIKYPNHKLVHVTAQQGSRLSKWYYVNARSNQNNYNWEFVEADIGGQRFNAVKRTYIIPRYEFKPDFPAMGSAMPRDPEDTNADDFTDYKFPEGYVLALRQQVRADEVIDSLFVVEQRTYVQKVSLVSNEFDDATNGNLPITRTWYYADEVVPGTSGKTAAQLFLEPANAYWGVQANGMKNSGQQLTANWYLITNEKVVAGTPSSGVFTIRSYSDNITYSWPPVLNSIDMMDWVMRSGAVRYWARPVFSREGYAGPCKADIVETWQLTPFGLDNPETMKPLPIIYNCPFYQLSTGACLHGSVNAQADTGNADPVWAQNVGSTRNFPATTPTDWPESLLAADDQKPFRGGYLRTRITVYAPTTAPT